MARQTHPAFGLDDAGRADTRPRAAGVVSLLDVDPELCERLGVDVQAAARSELMVRVIRLHAGPWATDRLGEVTRGHLGLLIHAGLVARELLVDDVASLELLGPGDIVRPWQAAEEAALLRAEARWSVLADARLAVLDRQLAAKLAHYPEIYSTIVERLTTQSQRLATTQTISQLNRVDRRVLLLLWHLAERWGRVTPSGVHLPLALSHRLIAQLVGARRPTVSTALGDLGRRGEVSRNVDGTWLLAGERPGEPTTRMRQHIAPRRRMLPE